MSAKSTLLNAIDRALNAPVEKAEPAGNKLSAPTIPLTPLALQTVAAGIKGEVATAEEIRAVRKATELWKRIWETELAHVPEKAVERFNQQGKELVALIAAGKPLPSPQEIQGKAEWLADYAEVVAACKAARVVVSGNVQPVIRSVFARYAGLISERLKAMKRIESSQCEAVGMDWQPSADYLIHAAVFEWAERCAKPAPGNGGGGNPANALKGLGIEL